MFIYLRVPLRPVPFYLIRPSLGPVNTRSYKYRERIMYQDLYPKYRDILTRPTKYLDILIRVLKYKRINKFLA